MMKIQTNMITILSLTVRRSALILLLNQNILIYNQINLTLSYYERAQKLIVILMTIFIILQVLPDGSVLKINKTVIHDTDENGNGFFFQSSVHHIFQDKDEEDEEIVGDVVLNDEEEPDLATVDEAIDDTIVDIVENPEKLTVLDTIEDPSINEVLDE